MRTASLLAMAVALAARSPIECSMFEPKRTTSTAPARTKGKASHKQQARKAQRRNK